LRSSSTSRRRSARVDWACRLLASAVLLVAAAPVLALDPDRAVSQYLWDRWDLERGYPGGAVHAIAQAADGHLWIAADKGLVRFDGLTFTLSVPPPGAAGTGPAVLGLSADDQGGVWARLRGPRLLRQHQRALTPLDILGDGYTVVTAMLRGRDGMLLTPLGRGVLQYQQGRITTRVTPTQMPSSFVIAIAETSDGTLWLGTRDAGLLRVRPGTVQSVAEGLPDLKINALLPGPEGVLWIATDRGIARWTGTRIETAPLPPALRDAPAHAMARDRDGHVWIGFGARGLARVDARGEAAVVPWDARARGDVTALFEDRGGNLWIGTSRGIERLRDGAFRTFTSAQGLPDDGVGPIFADMHGRLWMGPPSGGLYWLDKGRIHRVRDADLDQDVIYSISGRDGDVWVGCRRGGLARVRVDGEQTRVFRVTVEDGLAQNSVFAVHHARDGSVWAGTLSGGVSRYQQGSFSTYGVGAGLASNTVAAMLETTDGSLWIGTPAGVSIKGAAGWRLLDTRHGLPASDVTTLLQDHAGIVWVGTSAGLAYVAGGRAHPVTREPRLAGAILGLAADRDGRLWIATPDHLLQADPDGLRSAAASDPAVREFGAMDGLPGGDGIKRHRSLIADGAGSVWVSQGRGLAQFDATRNRIRREPTAAVIDAVAGDAGALPFEPTVPVPARTRRITLTLGGANLTMPERVRFRYRLDGFDAGWSAPTTARQAIYTNLPPGSYDFRLMASDADGAWTGGEARIGLYVAPAYWQSRWFQGSAALAMILAAWAAYRVRMRQESHRLAHVFEERLAERTRIAQDLHDTLLQGCLSASMQLHVAVDSLAEQEPARPTLERVQHLLARVIDEGREAVRGLRVGGTSRDALEQALSRAPHELAPDHPAGFRVVVDGPPRPLHPIIRDEVYRIGREAIANAMRHAEARRIEVEVGYADAQLRLSVRDDGRGIDNAVLRDGRDGHWGLEGMRERAQAIRATLRIMSRSAAGTEVELVVPGSIAFVPDRSASPVRWWRRRRTAVSVGDATHVARDQDDRHE
jgi:ligand-binding sensor domain-containing protein/signal transduction histidine kinase